MEASILNCKQKIQAGFYQIDSKILYITENGADTKKIMSQRRIFKHPRAACLQLNGTRIFQSRWSRPELADPFRELP